MLILLFLELTTGKGAEIKAGVALSLDATITDRQVGIIDISVHAAGQANLANYTIYANRLHNHPTEKT